MFNVKLTAKKWQMTKLVICHFLFPTLVTEVMHFYVGFPKKNWRVHFWIVFFNFGRFSWIAIIPNHRIDKELPKSNSDDICGDS